MYCKNMTNNKTNLLEITPEQIAADWTLGLRLSIAEQFRDRDYILFEGGISSDKMRHINGTQKVDPCPIASVKNLIEEEDAEWDGEGWVTRGTNLSAEVACTCGEISGRASFTVRVGEFLQDLAT